VPAADEYFRGTGCCEPGKGKESAQRVHEVCTVPLFTTLLLLLLPLLLIHLPIPLVFVVVVIIIIIIIINYPANFVISYTFLDQAPMITHSSLPDWSDQSFEFQTIGGISQGREALHALVIVWPNRNVGKDHIGQNVRSESYACGFAAWQGNCALLHRAGHER
jgi:hypothetical protein